MLNESLQLKALRSPSIPEGTMKRNQLGLLVVACCAILLHTVASGQRALSPPNPSPQTRNPFRYQPAPTTRDPLLWPFSSQSIWNVPIGSKAVYVPAELETPTQGTLTVDEDYIVLTPNEPLLNVYENHVQWNKQGDRTLKDGNLIARLPIPKDWEVTARTWDGLTPNAGLAVLLHDGHTLFQTQPFAYDPRRGYATSLFVFPLQDIYGEGIRGAHGGSGLSCLGGTLRNDELSPSSGPIRHALKVNLFAAHNVYYNSELKGFRWPANRMDDIGATYGKQRTRSVPIPKAMRVGALLAIPASVRLDDLHLETVPGRMLGQAFQDYGAYDVDDTAWSVFAIETQWSPSGRFTTNFKKNWGFDFVAMKTSSPWSRDIARIYAALSVVDNNSPLSIGGGGIPRAPLAPPFAKSSASIH
jgi:hypothetical protein